MRSNAKEVIKKLQSRLSAVQKEAPMVLANAGQKVFNDNFRRAEYDGKPWRNVERRIPGTYAYKYPKNKYLARRVNPILVGKTRQLKNAVNRAINRSKTNKYRLVYTISVPYAEFHNYGIGQRRRQFMGIDRKFRTAIMTKYQAMFRAATK